MNRIWQLCGWTTHPYKCRAADSESEVGLLKFQKNATFLKFFELKIPFYLHSCVNKRKRKIIVYLREVLTVFSEKGNFLFFLLTVLS